MAYKFKSMEKLVGFFIVFTMLTVIAFLIMIGRGKEFFIKKNFYYTYYRSAQDITTSMEVVYNGLPIGKVKDMELMPDNRIYVRMMIRREYESKIKADSVAAFLKPTMGSGTIYITTGTTNSSVLTNNAQIISSHSKYGSKLLRDQRPDVALLDDLINNVNELTVALEDPEGALMALLWTINDLVLSINSVTVNLDDNRDRINDILISLQESMDNFVEISENLKHKRLIGGKPEKRGSDRNIPATP